MQEELDYEKYRTLCPIPPNCLFVLKEETIQKKKEPTVTVFGKEYKVWHGIHLNVDGIVSYQKIKSINDIQGIYEFKDLTSLILSWNSIYDISGLKNLKKLSRLDLGHNRYLRDLTPIAELKELTQLNISGTEADDLTALAGLNELCDLKMAHTKVKNLDALEGLKKLRYLDVTNCSLENISVLAKLENLEELNLAGVKLKDIRVLESLKNLRKLTIDNSDNSISGWHMAVVLLNLENLVELNIVLGYRKKKSYLGCAEIKGMLKQEMQEVLKKIQQPKIDTWYHKKIPTVGFSCLYFGSYPQIPDEKFKKQMEDGTLKENLDYHLDANGDYVCASGEKYRKLEDDYFQYKRICWRVLDIQNQSALLMANEILDVQPYFKEDVLWCVLEDEDKISWETSSLRHWLNDEQAGSFYNSAFSEAEKIALVQEEDKVRVLTLEELTWEKYASYGLQPLYQKGKTYIDYTLEKSYSVFAEYKGLNIHVKKVRRFGSRVYDLKRGSYWLKDTVDVKNKMMYINRDGKIVTKGTSPVSTTIGVRPIIKVDLLKIKDFMPAETIQAMTDISSYAASMCDDEEYDF